MRLEVWRHDPRDPDSGTCVHDIECDDWSAVGGILQVRRVVGGETRTVMLVRAWDWIEIDPERAAAPEQETTP